MKRLAILVFLAACGGDKLSQSECREWAEISVGEDLDAVVGGEAELQEFREEVMRDLIADCRKGTVDRKELECMRAAKGDDLAIFACKDDAADRHHRKRLLPR